MSLYNLPLSKSLKKLVNSNPKSTHIPPASVLQAQRQSAVSLSKLNSYKGKFSLTSKYNSLSSQNNNEAVKYESNECHDKGYFMSDNNKQNIPSRANLMNTGNINISYENQQSIANQTKPSYTLDHKTDKISKNLSNENQICRQGMQQPQKTVIKTEKNYGNSQQETQNMQKIIKAANSFNLNNFIDQKASESLPIKNQFKPKPIQQNKVSIEKKKISKENMSQNNLSKPISVAQRRSKFHKYDDAGQNNQFLVIDDNEIVQQTNIMKKPSITSQASKRKQSHKNKVRKQTIKLSQIEIKLQQSNLKKENLQSEVFDYEQSIKHITYSMIKMISLIAKLKTGDKGVNTDQRNLKIMNQIRDQIFSIYSKELGKYIDKLKIREQIVTMAKQEEQFLKSTLKEIQSNKINKNFLNNHHHSTQNFAQSQGSSRYDYSISHPTHSQDKQDDHSSLLNSYEVHQSFSEENSLNADSLNRRDENSLSKCFFDFDSIKNVEIMPSGRNLLETFNNQHLCSELQTIGSELINELEQSRKADFQKMGQQTNREFRKKGIQKKSHQVDNQTIVMYSENLSYGLKQISIQEIDPSEQQENSTHVCRKLFNQQEFSSFKSNNNNLSPINHLHSTISVLSTHNQNNYMQVMLLAGHYYEITKNQSEQGYSQTSGNYLKLNEGDTIKLLRRVDDIRWIAQLDDRIGFVDETRVLKRVRLIGVTPNKRISENQCQHSSLIKLQLNDIEYNF